MIDGNKYLETLHQGFGQHFEIKEVLFEQKTAHQHLIIFNNPFFGRIMALDGVIQTSERDEFVYHEMLAHAPILAHGNVKRVLIIGGGDGGILREVTKHSSVEHITMVEIDAKVVEMCTTYLPNHSAGAYDDPRLNLVICDGKDFVVNNTEKFDVIISDSTDPIGPGESLFTSAFYQGCKNSLTEGGILVTQNGVCFLQLEEVTTTYQRLAPYFNDRSFYHTAVPTYYGGSMTFAWGSDNPALRSVDTAILQQRFEASGINTRYYTPAIHAGSMALPQYVLNAIQSVENNRD